MTLQEFKDFCAGSYDPQIEDVRLLVDQPAFAKVPRGMCTFFVLGQENDKSVLKFSYGPYGQYGVIYLEDISRIEVPDNAVVKKFLSDAEFNNYLEGSGSEKRIRVLLLTLSNTLPGRLAGER